MAVHVVGLGGRTSLDDLRSLLADARIVARNRQIAESVLPDSYSIEEAFDSWFDDDIDRALVDRIATRITAMADAASDVAYLVPGFGVIGDITVEALSARTNITVYPGRIDPGAVSGQAQIIDALALAMAELDHPFDAGLSPLDSQAPVLVTNLYGTQVIELAKRRLSRVYFEVDFSSPTSGELFIGAADPLVSSRSLTGFERIIARLRSPGGCPWDREQTAASLQPQLLEEVEELGEAIVNARSAEIADELGDVLLHVVMIAQIAREEGLFDLNDVIAGIGAKMVRRHPHVFGEVEINSIEELYENWDRIKAAEKANSG